MVHVLEAVCQAHDDPHPRCPVEILKHLDCKVSNSVCRQIYRVYIAYAQGGNAKVKFLTMKMLRERSIWSILVHHHPHEGFIFYAKSEEIDKVLVVDS